MGFAEGVGANVTQPSAGIIENGYAYGSIPPSAEWNWILRQAHRRARAHTSLRAAALAGLVLDQDAIDLRAVKSIGETIDESAKVVLTGYESLIATDGERVFVVYEDPMIVAAFDADSFAYLWELDCAAKVSALACGGGKLFVGHDSGIGGRKFTVVDAESGAELGYYTKASAQVVRSLAYGEVGGDGFVALVYTGGEYVFLHNLDDFTADGDFDHGDVVHSVAARGSLVAVSGIQSVSHGNISLLDASVPSAPTEIWTVTRAGDPTDSWCGFVGDAVAYLERGGGDELLLYPIARFASAPSALGTLAVDVISGTKPVIGDFGVAYCRAGASKLMQVNAKLEQLCLSVGDGLVSLAWAGNRFLCVTDTNKVRAVSSTTTPVRVMRQFGQLAGVR